jgi:hypothetical protein
MVVFLTLLHQFNAKPENTNHFDGTTFSGLTRPDCQERYVSMFIPPSVGGFRSQSPSSGRIPQARFSGFNRKGAMNDVATALGNALDEAGNVGGSPGQSEEQQQIVAEAARKKYDTRPYEAKFIDALAQDVADHFKKSNEPIPSIPAAKMAKNAIAWIVAYGRESFNIISYKPSKKGESGGSVYTDLLKSKAEVIPWPDDETEEQKAGWPISKTPLDDLQKRFEAKLEKLNTGPSMPEKKSNVATPNSRIKRESKKPNRKRSSPSPVQSLSAESTDNEAQTSRTKTKAKGRASYISVNTGIQTSSSDLPNFYPNAQVQTDIEAGTMLAPQLPAELVPVKKHATAGIQTSPADLPNFNPTAQVQTDIEPGGMLAAHVPSKLVPVKKHATAGIQTSPSDLPNFNPTAQVQTDIEPGGMLAAHVPSKLVPVKKHTTAGIQTSPSDLPNFNPTAQVQTDIEAGGMLAAHMPSKLVPVKEHADRGTSAYWQPKTLAVSTSVEPSSPKMHYKEYTELNWGDSDPFDIEQVLDADELNTLLQSKPGTQKLFAWFSPKYQGTDKNEMAIAFSRFLRDLRDPGQPVNEDNLYSYFRGAGPTSPEPPDLSREKSRRKRKASPGNLSS